MIYTQQDSVYPYLAIFLELTLPLVEEIYNISTLFECQCSI